MKRNNPHPSVANTAFMVCALALAVGGCSEKPTIGMEAPAGRKGLSYFREVGPGMYCGGQPTAEGLAELRKLGVKTIIDLRTGMLGGCTPEDAPFERVHIPVVPVYMEDQQVELFLRTVRDCDKPVYFHCLYGADRTGAMAAAYRMVVEGWEKDRAVKEMTGQGIPIGVLCHGLVAYVENLDVEAMRTRLKLHPPHTVDGAAILASDAMKSEPTMTDIGGR